MNKPVASALSEIEGFLRGLKHTGGLGFEGFVVRLLQASTGQRFRIAGSGFQAGMDAATEAGHAFANRVKVETKHYFSTDLDLRELTAEIIQAAADSDFDLWVLACTCAAQAQHTTKLQDYASEYGVECLFLDRPQSGLARLEVLMAAHADVVERFRLDCGSASDGPALEAELRTITADPDYSGTLTQLRAKLGGSLLGYADAQTRAKTALLRDLGDVGNAEATFNQNVAIRAPGVKLIVRRAPEAMLADWWASHALRGRHGVVLGEEGMGKSWVSMAWLAGRVEGGGTPLALAFNASTHPFERGATVEGLLPGLLRRATGQGDDERWARRLSRWMERSDGAEPLVVIFVDGLNERADVDWVSFFRPLRHERWRGRVAVLATDRPGHWGPHCSRLEADGFERLPVGVYAEQELVEALEGRGVSLQDVPAGLHELISTPRYCDLVATHFEDMRRHDDFTRERLVLLDVRHRRDAKRGFPMSEDEFIDVVRALARRFRDRAALRLEDVRALMPGIEPRSQIYQEIIDGGLLVRLPSELGARYVVETNRLVFGLGMLLADDVTHAATEGATEEALAEVVATWLEPHADGDLKVQVCAAAVFHALLEPEHPASARRALIRHWLGSRNRFDDQDEARLAFVLRAPAVFLGITESFWTARRDQGAAQAYLGMAFSLHRDDDRLRPLLGEAIERWMGVVHPSGPPLLRRGGPGEEERRREVEARAGRTLTPGTVEVGDAA